MQDCPLPAKLALSANLIDGTCGLLPGCGLCYRTLFTQESPLRLTVDCWLVPVDFHQIFILWNERTPCLDKCEILIVQSNREIPTYGIRNYAITGVISPFLSPGCTLCAACHLMFCLLTSGMMYQHDVESMVKAGFKVKPKDGGGEAAAAKSAGEVRCHSCMAAVMPFSSLIHDRELCGSWPSFVSFSAHQSLARGQTGHRRESGIQVCILSRKLFNQCQSSIYHRGEEPALPASVVRTRHG